jgi:hypothetical protein
MAERKSFLLRLSPELWAQLQRLADADMRSVNAEIEFLLREAVRKRIGPENSGKRESDATDE